MKTILSFVRTQFTLDKLKKSAFFLLGTSALLLIGFYLDKINLKGFSFLIFLSTGSFLVFAPLPWAIHLLVLYLGVEGFAKLMTNYNPIIHVGADILIVSLWGRILLTLIVQRKSLPSVLPPLSSLFFIHVIWFVITIVNPNSINLEASLAGAKLYLTIVSLYFFGYYLTTDAKSVKAFMIPWVIVGLLEVTTSIYQSSIGPSSVTSLSPSYTFALKKYGDFAFRPFGLTSQPGAPSIYIYIVFPFILYFLFESRSWIVGLLMLLLLPASILTLFVCQVRSALLKATLSSIACILYVVKRMSGSNIRTKAITFPILLITLISVGMITPVLLDKISGSYKDNQRAIERTLTLFDYSKVSQARVGALDRFLDYAQLIPFGAGLSRIGAAAGHFQNQIVEDGRFKNVFFSDNLWIEMLIDLGLPGLIILNLIIFMILQKGIVGFFRMKDPQLKTLQWTLLCSISTILIGAYGAEPILYNPEGPFFWFFSGVLVRLPMLDQEAREESLA